ncbi:protein MOR1 [Tanacetum coccineum]
MTLGGFVSRLITMIFHVLTTRTTVDDDVAPRRNAIFTFKVPDQNLLTTRRTMDDEDAPGLKAVPTFQVLTNTISFIIKYNVLQPAEMTTLESRLGSLVQHDTITLVAALKGIFFTNIINMNETTAPLYWQEPNPHEYPVEQVATSPPKTKRLTRNCQKRTIQSDDAPRQTVRTTKKEIVLAQEHREQNKIAQSLKGAAAATKKTVKASDSVSSVFGGGLDSLPREDNSGKITPELLKLLECSDWKTRSESLEEVLMFSFAPEAEGFFRDIGPQMVLKNVRDIHGLALAIFLGRLNSHGAFPEVHDKTRATGTGPTVKTTSKIGKSNGYGSKSESRAISSVRYGSYTLFFPICEINIQIVSILYFKRGVSAKGSKAVSITSVQDISGPVGSRLAFTRTEPQWERHPMAQPSVIDPTDCNEATPSRKNTVSRLNSYPDHITPITRQIQAPCTTEVPSTSTEVPSTSTEVPSTSTEVPSTSTSGNGMEIDNSDLTFGIHPYYVEKGDNSVEAKGFDFLAPTTRRNSMHVLRAMQFYLEEVHVLERRLVLALGKFSGHFGLWINLSKQVIAESL